MWTLNRGFGDKMFTSFQAMPNITTLAAEDGQLNLCVMTDNHSHTRP